MTYEDAISRCWLEVDLDAIRENYRAACEMVGDGAQIIPVLKANAYGMNAVEVAGALKTEGARLFAVASSDEAEQLLREIPGIEVLVMGLVGEGALRRLIGQNMPIALFSERQGEKIARIAAELGVVARVHVKVDTGLHRLGLEPERAAEYVEGLCAGGNVRACGLFTHLAIHTAEMDSIQVQKLLAVRDALAKAGIEVPLTHAVDSIGMVRYPESHLDGARVGAWLYGVTPRRAPKPSRCVGRFVARIAQLRRVAKGELIGYDDDHPLDRDSLIATISAGYIDGTPRVGEGWQVEIRGRRANVIGIACMDQLMADVTDIPDVNEGDEVVFVGGGIDVEEYSKMGRFNHNEAWARIGRRVPRIFYESGKPVRVRAEL